jgi:hypothetical protein
MTVTISKPALNLREELAAAKRRGGYAQEMFWFDGDSSTTNFALPKGWLPKFVYVDGALVREGAAEDYTVQFDGFIYSVEMAVAPAAVDVGIIAEGQF